MYYITVFYVYPTCMYWCYICIAFVVKTTPFIENIRLKSNSYSSLTGMRLWRIQDLSFCAGLRRSQEKTLERNCRNCFTRHWVVGGLIEEHMSSRLWKFNAFFLCFFVPCLRPAYCWESLEDRNVWFVCYLMHQAMKVYGIFTVHFRFPVTHLCHEQHSPELCKTSLRVLSTCDRVQHTVRGRRDTLTQLKGSRQNIPILCASASRGWII